MKKTVLFLLVALITRNAYADTAQLFKSLKDKLNQNTTSASTSGGVTTTIPKSDPLSDRVKERQQQYQEENRLSVAPPTDSSGAKTTSEVDIKGIKIGMSIEDVKKLVATNSKPGSCSMMAISSENETYVYGDQAILCKRGFEYFGSTVDHMNAFFIQGKLSFVALGTFYSETEEGQELPTVFKALADKYQVKPELRKQPRAGKGAYLFDTHIVDVNSNELVASGELDQDLSGNQFKNVSLVLQAPNLAQVQSNRERQMKENEAKKAQAVEMRKKEDL